MKTKKQSLQLNNYLALFSFMAVILFTGCNKLPVADFTLDKSEYTAGEVVKCTNISDDASSYKWTFPDGQTSASQNVEYTLNENTPAGTYYIKLEAISRKGNKKTDATKAFTVKAASGQLTVWTSNSTVNQISVKVDNVSMGTITLYYSSNPGCGANGCVTAKLTVGQHTITATDGTFSWNGTINISKDLCSTFQLQ